MRQVVRRNGLALSVCRGPLAEDPALPSSDIIGRPKPAGLIMRPLATFDDRDCARAVSAGTTGDRRVLPGVARLRGPRVGGPTVRDHRRRRARRGAAGDRRARQRRHGVRPAWRPFLVAPDARFETLGWARHARDQWPLFVKPTTGRKEFTGLVLRRTDDLLKITSQPDDLPVYVSAAVDFRDRVEWRAFLIDGTVRDIRPYSASPNGDAPTKTLIQSFANQWASIPAGCSIDVVNLGDNQSPDWRIVECNDGYSLGSYGLFRHTYTELLVKRWAQLNRVEITW
jgi:hypothetical protein